MTARDDLALDLETVDAQCEVMPRAPLRMLACGHEKRTHRTDVAHCRACRGEPHAVLTTAQCIERAASALRAAQEFENHAHLARMRAAAYQRHIETTTKGDTDR